MTRAAAAAVGAIAVAGAAWLLAAADPAPSWQLVTPAQVELVPGVAGTLSVVVAPGDGRTVSRDGPLRLDIKPPDGLVVTHHRLSLADATDPAAASPAFTIKLTAAKAGSYPVEIAVRLWLCARQTCKPVRATRTVTVEVATPPAPDAAPAPPDASPRPIDAPRKRIRR